MTKNEARMLLINAARTFRSAGWAALAEKGEDEPAIPGDYLRSQTRGVITRVGILLDQLKRLVEPEPRVEGTLPPEAE